MNGPIFRIHRTGLFVFLLAFVLLPAFATGCHRGARPPGQDGTPVSRANGASGYGEEQAEAPFSLPSPEQQASGKEPSSSVAAESVSPAGPAGIPTDSPAVSLPPSAETGTHEPETKRTAVVKMPEEGELSGEVSGREMTKEGAAPHAEPQPLPPFAALPAPSVPDAEAGSGAAAVLAGEGTVSRDAPPWAKEKEELAYKVEFLGITMGYARFSFLGKVQLSGREAYHLRVRAWTSDLLSIIYPIDDTIDYYLDVQTLAPLRQEFTRSRKEDDVAIYDQENGTIVYRYRKDGTIRKKVDVLPNVYDPVSVAYYFRTRDLETEKEELSMYAGRKLWEISAKPVGFERIRTDRGEFDTIVVQPVLRRDGKVEDEKKMRMWMTRDDRHVPVRVYAKFRKIRTWTLVGELLPDREGG